MFISKLQKFIDKYMVATIKFIVLPISVAAYIAVILFVLYIIKTNFELVFILIFGASIVFFTFIFKSFIMSNFELINTIRINDKLVEELKIFDDIHDFARYNYHMFTTDNKIYVSRYIYDIMQSKILYRFTMETIYDIKFIVDPYRKKYSYGKYKMHSTIESIDDIK